VLFFSQLTTVDQSYIMPHLELCFKFTAIVMHPNIQTPSMDFNWLYAMF